MPGPFNGGGKMGRNSTQTGAGGPMGTGGASKGKTNSTGDKNKVSGLFDINNPRIQSLIGGVANGVGLKTVEGIANKVKQDQSGDKRPDANLLNMNGVNQTPVSDVQKAVIESRRQRKEQETGLDIAQGVMGLMPGGMGTAFGVGRKMGIASEDEAFANPDRFTTIPGDPGGIKSKTGPLTSNRALPAPSAKSTTASADESIKKKKQPLPTLLGAPAQALGTFSNPLMIT